MNMKSRSLPQINGLPEKSGVRPPGRQAPLPGRRGGPCRPYRSTTSVLNGDLLRFRLLFFGKREREQAFLELRLDLFIVDPVGERE